MKKRILILFILVISLTTCIDPYVLDLDDYESLLVVDGMITDEAVSYTIKLSRTFQNEETPRVMISNAEVSVRDENGGIVVFQEKETGIYKSDSTQFTGRIGGTYTLHIKTDDGLEYESDPSTMTAVPAIDSIYYAADNEFINNGREEEKGLRIFLDASNKEKDCKYFRWEFEEVWQFQIPYPVEYKYLGGDQVEIIPVVENEICWKQGQSSEILIYSTEAHNTSQISRQPIKFIASGKSNRLRKQYSILVKQYSLSQNEFTFWKNLQEVTESGGDIFERQPFSVIGNIHCTNRENEKVLGYFQVSAIKKMRKYITYSQIADIDIPFYRYPCESNEFGPWDLLGDKTPWPVPPWVYETIYRIHMHAGYVFIGMTDMIGPTGLVLNSFVFTTPECADCTLSGDPNRPDFWVDMN